MDPREHKLAQILVQHSTRIQPGDRLAIRTTTSGTPLARAIFEQALERGGLPQLLLELPDEDRLWVEKGNDNQLDYIPTFRKLVADEFESYIYIYAFDDPHRLEGVDPARQARRKKALAYLLNRQLERGAEGSYKWAVSLYPTEAYAREAGMGMAEFQDFVYRACHAAETTADPIAYWQGVEREQDRLVEQFAGHDRVELRGPNVDLQLSIKDRRFLNAAGRHNLPDGEIYTSPLEDSAQGWVRFTYPALREGRSVEGVELTFEQGRVVQASAKKNEGYLTQILDVDPGARYLGEFAIGTNYQIDRFTGNILFDEKIGGTFHLAIGTGFPEIGSQNTSKIHWDMISDLRSDSEIRLDGEVIYRNGAFVS